MHSEAMLEPAVVSWFWSLGGFRSSLDTGLGLPDFRAVSPNLQLGCYLCFSLCTPRPRDPSKISEISPFIVDQYSCEILWVMRPSSMSDSEQDAKQVLRSVEFYSALDFLWIPEHGVEFVGIFLHHLLAKWDELLKQARLHLTQSVSTYRAT